MPDVFGRTGLTPTQFMRGRGGGGGLSVRTTRKPKVGGLVVVTGDEELDAVLRTLSPRLQKKFVRGALRKSMKRVKGEFEKIVRTEAYATGAYLKSTKVRSMKRSRSRIGMEFHVDRDKYFERYQAKYGKKPSPRKGETEPHYVPASIEFGFDLPNGTHVEAVRPQRRALYDNQQAILGEFKNDVKQLIAEAASK